MANKSQLTVSKLDLRKKYKYLYSPSAKQVEVVDVPELLFTMVDGQTEPGTGPSASKQFGLTMEAMYGVAYGLKFMSKLREKDPIDFTVMAMEGLWESTSGSLEFGTSESMTYTLLMLQPEHITQEMFQATVAEAAAKRPNPVLDSIKLGRWTEGPSIQIMHIGPYADEPRTIERLEAYAGEHGYRLRGRHHEIYLGDPRRAKPENLKTIIRHAIDTD